MAWYDVKVTFTDGVHPDAIQGTSLEDALKNAYDNWAHPTLEKIEIDND